MATRRPDYGGAPGLGEISTYWPLITDPARFVLRYAPAIRAYLTALLQNADDAEEATQDFLLKGLLRGFVRTEELRGRFRDYLKAAVRNAALTRLRRRGPAPAGAADLPQLPDPHGGPSRADREWLAEWRGCVIDRALQALDRCQRQTPGNLFHTVLRLTLDHPDEDSAALAARAGALAGRPVRADAFRKQLSRARRRFAELLVAEVTQTLERPTPERVAEELAETGLLPFVRDFLHDPGRPADAP
jgi:RNA polymerase sigma-70 factor (ECF subfamily)